MEPLDVIIVGSALNDFGFMAYNTIEGLGLNTFGELWPCAGIWAPAADSVTTTWVSAISSVSTETCID